MSTNNGGASNIDPEDLAPSDDELGGPATLAEGLKRLAVEPLDRRFHGKSSGLKLLMQTQRDDDTGAGGLWQVPLQYSRLTQSHTFT